MIKVFTLVDTMLNGDWHSIDELARRGNCGRSLVYKMVILLTERGILEKYEPIKAGNHGQPGHKFRLAQAAMPRIDLILHGMDTRNDEIYNKTIMAEMPMDNATE